MIVFIQLMCFDPVKIFNSSSLFPAFNYLLCKCSYLNNFRCIVQFAFCNIYYGLVKATVSLIMITFQSETVCSAVCMHVWTDIEFFGWQSSVWLQSALSSAWRWRHCWTGRTELLAKQRQTPSVNFLKQKLTAYISTRLLTYGFLGTPLVCFLVMTSVLHC